VIPPEESQLTLRIEQPALATLRGSGAIPISSRGRHHTPRSPPKPKTALRTVAGKALRKSGPLFEDHALIDGQSRSCGLEAPLLLISRNPAASHKSARCAICSEWLSKIKLSPAIRDAGSGVDRRETERGPQSTTGSHRNRCPPCPRAWRWPWLRSGAAELRPERTPPKPLCRRPAGTCLAPHPSRRPQLRQRPQRSNEHPDQP